MLTINSTIQEAINNNKPVVLIETAFFAGSCGKNFNLDDVNAIASAVIEQGATPAYLGVIEGEIIVGLSKDQINYLMNDEKAIRGLGPNKLAYVEANKLNGGVNNALMFQIAKTCNLPFTVTGGIGGVSRVNSFDISSDIYELSKNPVLVCCAGPKSMLDVSATREAMETYNISVGGYHVNMMPSFFSRESCYKLDFKSDNPEEIAKIFKIQSKELNTGMLIGVPVSEEYDIPFETVEEIVKDLMNNCEEKLSDRYLLGNLQKELNKKFNYDSKKACVDMFTQSAKLAAQIAVNYSNL